MTQRGKMSVEMRAKQFMPFSALPGLDEALAMTEKEAEGSGAERRSLTDHDMIFSSASSESYEELNEEDH